MLAYLYSLVLFLLQFGVGLFISRYSRPLRKTNSLIKQDFIVYVEQEEKKHNLTNPGFLRMRTLALFAAIKDENEKEEIRDNLRSIVIKHNGNPKKLLLLNFLTLLVSVVCLYTVILFLKTEPILYLSYFVNILVILMWISRKRWIFSVVFGVFGYFTYPFIQGHLMMYIGMNLLVGYVIFISKKNKKSR